MTSVLERSTDFNECLVCKLLDTRMEQIQTTGDGLYASDYTAKMSILWGARRQHAKECQAQMDFVLLAGIFGADGGT